MNPILVAQCLGGLGVVLSAAAVVIGQVGFDWRAIMLGAFAAGWTWLLKQPFVKTVPLAEHEAKIEKIADHAYSAGRKYSTFPPPNRQPDYGDE